MACDKNHSPNALLIINHYLPMPRRYQQRTRTCGSLALTALLLLLVVVQWSLSRQDAQPVPRPTLTATPTFISRQAIVGLPTRTPYLQLPKLSTFTPTATLSPTSTQTPTPRPTATATATPEPTRRAQVTASLLYVRSGPGSDYSAQVILGAGEEVTVLGRTADGDWLQVRLLNGTEGWVFAELLSAISDVDVLAVRTPPPTP